MPRCVLQVILEVVQNDLAKAHFNSPPPGAASATGEVGAALCCAARVLCCLMLCCLVLCYLGVARGKLDAVPTCNTSSPHPAAAPIQGALT